MNSMLSVFEGLWTHVGPGLLLVLALPVLLFVLALVVVAGRGRGGPTLRT